ncbi:MAG: rhodanese-like domain-containing protein [bacterium]|nr:rhodanese-like domain-containing protein [bacterium]
MVLTIFFAACDQNKINNNDIKLDEKNIIIDTRTKSEYENGHLKNAINIPYTEIKEKIEEHVHDKEEKIIVYCRTGIRSGIAKKILVKSGYKNVINAGAYDRLKGIESNKGKSE